MTSRAIIVVQLAVAAAGIAVIAATWKSSASVVGIGLIVASLAIGGVRLSLLGSWVGAAVYFVACAVLVALAATRVG
ncbi:MAG TPA: hypothetical protein VFD50_11670 [Thermoleophilia bacterium]|nr:hypothetical protein [Thermoleophilia bacterium]